MRACMHALSRAQGMLVLSMYTYVYADTNLIIWARTWLLSLCKRVKDEVVLIPCDLCVTNMSISIYF
jgi:hypothetical protein